MLPRFLSLPRALLVNIGEIPRVPAQSPPTFDWGLPHEVSLNVAALKGTIPSKLFCEYAECASTVEERIDATRSYPSPTSAFVQRQAWD
jgi:hypothetical protein